jgi:acyl carrier protein
MNGPKFTDASFETPPEITPPTGPSSLDAVFKVLYESISELNLQLPQNKRIEKSPATILSGEGGKLDSLSLANFIVIAEQKLEDAFGFRVDLTEDDPFSPATGHFRTLQSLATYFSTLVRRNSESTA